MIPELTARTRLGAVDLLPFIRRDAGETEVELRDWERRPAALVLSEWGWSPERVAHATGLRVEDVREVLQGNEPTLAFPPEPETKAKIRLRHMSERELVNGRWIHPQATHGTVSGYKHWGCRCWPCSDAKSLVEAENRRRRAEAAYRVEEALAMPWFMTDDKFHSHKKTVRATAGGVAPVGLWVLAGSWSADQLTDGFIPEYIAMRYDPYGWEENAAALVRAGLWVEDKQDGEPGWRFHEWEERQPTREKVIEKREAAKARMEKLRASRKSGSQDVRANNERTDSELPAKFADGSQQVRSTPALPNPSLPTLKESEGDKRPPRKRGQRLPEPFEVTEEMRKWARENTPDVGQSEHAKFCDYYRSAPGQKGVKLDWVATWRNWMRRAQEDRPSNVVAIRGNKLDEKHAMLQQAMQRAAALDALEAGGTA